MIIDLIKSGEYKNYRTITFIKDYIIVWVALIGVALLIGLGISFILWTDWIVVVTTGELFGTYFRISFVLAFIVSLFFNVRSHQIEIHKMQGKK